ncbi:glycosyltransferase family 4 protein [Phormidium pseudopriestleyi FRX01]|uniref:Glycosyltransferase family 4 protein n=1 Tax=Phormidium pseudopriestleyi FRX01 TaxID=1759528 RepID=A0ABS3FLR3_9CYAN|nr:glycosyltransferase family 4 protein [Phormidium pseudopriestleyi]MBO0347768.1 glycosyltransferase family 4 protein [Phormidium pseudopriestleyi FRX01]
MQILFLHPNFPAQFRHLATVLGSNPNNTVVFGTKNERPEWVIPGVKKALFEPSRDPHPGTHHYVRPLESAVIYGQAVYRMAEQLKTQGFVPDVIYGHSGWGPTIFAKDIYPETPLMCYFEWYYHAYGSDANFDPNDPLNADDVARIRVKNAPILIDLASCDWGVSPTYWQRSQFPPEFHSKLSVVHDGVDTEYFKPDPGAKLVLPNLDLSHVDELVTYVARGMEPYRGFPEFIEAVGYIQERRPNCHVVVVGSDRVCYGKSLPNGETYKDYMLKKVPLDLTRVHFVGSLPYGLYLKVIQASDVHIYLTRPFVLSWSMIESLSTGCLVLGSDTQPVREVITDGENGLLVDFFSPKQIADRVDEVFNHPTRMAEIRKKARETAIERYAMPMLLKRHLQLIEDVASGVLNNKSFTV